MFRIQGIDIETKIDLFSAFYMGMPSKKQQDEGNNYASAKTRIPGKCNFAVSGCSPA